MTTKEREIVLSHFQLILPTRLRQGAKHTAFIFTRAVYPNAGGCIDTWINKYLYPRFSKFP